MLRPTHHLLEGDFELILANAQHIRNVPGRKTDVSDAAWIADLLAHGLIRSSFVPPAPIQELRDLTRTRKQLVREVSQHSSRIQKVLEDANLKLGSVLSDVLGRSGRAIPQALIDGQSDPQRLADLAKGTARKKRAKLIEALHGRIRPHHRGLLKVHLNLVVTLEQAIADIDATVGKALESIHKSAQILSTIPGISDVTAHVIVAEIGVDMTRFATDAHLRSWAGFCPRSDESAGKRRSTRVRKGAPWLKTTLVSAAWAAVRVKESYLQAQFHRLRARPERKKPSSPSLLPCPPPPITCSRMAANTKISAPTTSLAATARRSSCAWVRRINDLGCQVQLVPQAA
jgi:transposase